MKRTESDTKLLSRQEVATVFGVTTRTISRWEERGILRAIRLNARVLRYRRDDIEKLITEAVDDL